MYFDGITALMAASSWRTPVVVELKMERPWAAALELLVMSPSEGAVRRPIAFRIGE